MAGLTPESPPVSTGTPAEAPQVPDVNTTAETSAAEPATDGGMLGAVKAALAPKTEESSASAGEGPKGSETEAEAAEGADDGEDLGDVTDEELQKYHSKTRRRIKGLLADRTRLTQEMETLRPQAEQFDRIVAFTRNAGLDPKEVNQLFEVGALMKRDPFKALELMQPYYEALLHATGNVLPADLRDEVRNGSLTEVRAREVAQARARVSTTTAVSERDRQQHEQQRQRDAQASHVHAVQGAVSTWETSKAASDPDWKLKQPRVLEKIKLHVHENGFPRTTEEAVQIAGHALKAVEDELKALAPRRQANTPVTTTGASTRSTAKPTTMLEAMRQAAGG